MADDDSGRSRMPLHEMAAEGERRASSLACRWAAHKDCLGATERSTLCECRCHITCDCGAPLEGERAVFLGECDGCYDATNRDYPPGY